MGQGTYWLLGCTLQIWTDAVESSSLSLSWDTSMDGAVVWWFKGRVKVSTCVLLLRYCHSHNLLWSWLELNFSRQWLVIIQETVTHTISDTAAPSKLTTSKVLSLFPSSSLSPPDHPKWRPISDRRTIVTAHIPEGAIPLVTSPSFTCGGCPCLVHS